MTYLHFITGTAAAVFFLLGIFQYGNNQIMPAIFWSICALAFAVLFDGLREYGK
jgi:hypothetical protein